MASSVSPGLQAALERLARVTVETGTDPAKVLQWLADIVQFKEEVWPTLTPYQRYAIKTRIRHLREEFGYVD